MLCKLKGLFLFLLGVGVGAIFQWIYFHNVAQIIPDKESLIEKIMVHADTSILEKNYACEGQPVKTVGRVMASLIELNAESKINKLAYGCFGSTCSVSYTDCKPWQSAECSTRFLKFKVDVNQAIEKNTFSCFDIP